MKAQSYLNNIEVQDFLYSISGSLSGLIQNSLICSGQGVNIWVGKLLIAHAKNQELFHLKNLVSIKTSSAIPNLIL
ncbi:hypothetical protein AHMF7605_04735 [Adhaeribacter arboris]|uniref:Uncharacterized protein n=1 Tax=Adhaeribacter arboris TaxID=2072846 RepID=A0A2T2YBJ6_9BACT|nr:hypothetical protein [Adhaeribacter arboris]PSR52879.1 hypothetical protein AHMF7605_04735 [Adhaeribacter arboris]